MTCISPRNGWTALVVLAACAVWPGPQALGDTGAAGESRLVSVKEAVTVDGQAARVGQVLSVGQVILTGGGAAASMMLGARGLVYLGAETELKVGAPKTAADGIQELAAEVAKGSVRALLGTSGKSPRVRLRLRSRSATMGVRGSEVLIESPPGTAPESWVNVEGEAEVQKEGSNEPIQLPEGQELTSDSDQPHALDPDTIQERADGVAPKPQVALTDGDVASIEEGEEPSGDLPQGGDGASEWAMDDWGDWLEFDPGESFFESTLKVKFELALPPAH